jgi:hypothetical protein
MTRANTRPLTPPKGSEGRETVVSAEDAVSERDLDAAPVEKAALIARTPQILMPETIASDIVMSQDEEEGFFQIGARPAGYYKPGPEIAPLRGILMTRQLVNGGGGREWYQYLVRATRPTTIWYWDGAFLADGAKELVARECKPLEIVALSESYQLYEMAPLLAIEGRSFEIVITPLAQLRTRNGFKVWNYDKKAREVELQITDGKLRVFPTATRKAQPADLSAPVGRRALNK